MKRVYKILLLMIMIIMPVNVLAMTQGECVKGAYYAKVNSSSGTAVARECWMDLCNSYGGSKEFMHYALQPTGKQGTCANGNVDPYKSGPTVNGTWRSGSCSNEAAQYIFVDYTYDCNRTSSGGTYVKVTQAPQTQPVTQAPYVPPATQAPYVPPATQAPQTQAPTTSSSTTSSSTTKKTTEKTSASIKVSSDVTIKEIVINNKTKISKPKLNGEYDITIPYSLDVVDLDVTTKDKNAKVVIAGAKDITSEGGVITITVTSSDTTATNVVTLNVTRYTKEQGDCTIGKMVVRNYDIGFSKGTEQYTLKLKNGEKTLDIDVTTNQPEANYVIQGNEKLKNNSKIKIIVNAVDGTECSYQITVKKSSNAWIYFVVIVVIGIVLFFVGSKLKEYLTMGHGKYKYE